MSAKEQTPVLSAELKLQKELDALKNTCDRICLQYPDNFLFFTQYGGMPTTQKLARDKRTDLDLRLICFELPSLEIQAEVQNQLGSLQTRFPVELYFHSFDAYVAGRVGETGDVTTLQAIREGRKPEETVVKLEHPSLVSLYTYATMHLFTKRTDQELDEWVKKVAALRENDGKLTSSQKELCSMENLSPETILKNIELDEPGIIEWMHMYLKYFLHDYTEYKRNSTESSLHSYVSRLNKYFIRIAFALSLIGFDYQQVKQDYVELLQKESHADLAHLTIIEAHKPYWLTDEVKTVLQQAVRNRVFDEGTLLKLSELSDLPELNRHQAQEFEMIILYLTQQLGGVLRKERFGAVHDFLTELAVWNLLEPLAKLGHGVTYTTYLEGANIITEGEESTIVYFIPIHKQDGSPNGSVRIESTGGVELVTGKVFIGELGMLTGNPRSASVVAHENIEVIALDTVFIEKLLQERVQLQESDFGDSLSKENKVSLLSAYLNNLTIKGNFSLEKSNKALLIYSLLNYFSNEFIAYLSNHIEFKTSENMLAAYRVAHFSEALSQIAVENKVAIQEEKVGIDQAPKAVFSIGDNDDGFLYIVGEVAGGQGKQAGVVLRFGQEEVAGETGGEPPAGEPLEQIFLASDSIFGESSLLAGSRQRNYSAIVLPGTTVLKIKARDFQRITQEAKPYKIVNSQGQEYSLTGAELFFHLGAHLIDRLVVGR